MKIGSLFDGIGGWPLAAVKFGAIPVWASEIEAFSIKVTKCHFPNMLPATACCTDKDIVLEKLVKIFDFSVKGHYFHIIKIQRVA